MNQVCLPVPCLHPLMAFAKGDDWECWQIGPHLGILAQHNFQIPGKIDEWIKGQLEERIIKELGLLVKKLRIATSRIKNLAPALLGQQASGVISRDDHLGNDLDRLTLHLPSTSPPSAASSSTSSSTLDSETSIDPSVIDLRTLSSPHHSTLFESLNHLLATDRKYLIRHALANQTRFSKELVGRHDPNAILKEGIISLSSGSERGQLVLPVMTALFRLKLYSGKGWGTQLWIVRVRQVIVVREVQIQALVYMIW